MSHIAQKLNSCLEGEGLQEMWAEATNIAIAIANEREKIEVFRSRECFCLFDILDEGVP